MAQNLLGSVGGGGVRLHARGPLERRVGPREGKQQMARERTGEAESFTPRA